MYQRQIYCNTEDSMVSKWDDNTLTSCPNDSEHSIASGSESIIQVARFTHHLKDNFSTSNTSYVPVTKFVFQGTNYYSNDAVNFKYLKIRSYSDVGTYNIRLLDPASNQIWTSGSLSNHTETVTTVDFDTLSLSSSEILYSLEAHGNSGSVCYISDVSIYSAFVAE